MSTCLAQGSVRRQTAARRRSCEPYRVLQPDCPQRAAACFHSGRSLRPQASDRGKKVDQSRALLCFTRRICMSRPRPLPPPPASSLSKEPSLRPRNQRKFVALHSGARRPPSKTRRVFPRAAIAAVVPSAPVARGWLVPCRLCAPHLAPTKALWRPGRACHQPRGAKRERRR
jgi:hypothetical protein